MDHLKAAIRTIPDFPSTGIQFKDITPLLADGTLFRDVIDSFKQRHAEHAIDIVVGIEARGFIFSSALAYALGAGTCMVRKSGKLPHTVHRKTYALEYGSDTVEIHTDALKPGQRVLILDDVLATGGTVAATVELIQKHFDVEIVEINFLVELTFLKGRSRLPDLPLAALIEY
ncbi:MAG: adenine phosphoribosyltransferase [Pontiella sp.]